VIKIIILILFLFPVASSARIDTREYVDWNAAPYNRYVRIVHDGSTCTGQFVSKNIILTASHCIHGSTPYEIQTSNGAKDSAVVIGQSNLVRGGDADYALLKTSSYESPVWFDDIGDASQTGRLSLVGFGNLKIMSDDEIRRARQEYENLFGNDDKNVPNIKWESNNMAFIQRLYNNIDRMIIFDDKNLKKSECEYRDHGAYIGSGCLSYHGNSGGGAYVAPQRLIGVVSESDMSIPGYPGGTYLTPSRTFKNIVEEYKK
jgi:hypothetical protein